MHVFINWANKFYFEPVLAAKTETQMAWYVYAASGAGSPLFLLIAAGLLVLLWRRRRSNMKQGKTPGTGEGTEMKTMEVTSPKKTEVKCNYLSVRKDSADPPVAV